MENSLKLSGTAILHGADVVARTNAYALRSLRNEWVFKSSLNRDIKERVKKAPLCNGMAPEDKSIEFVAPIVGPVLQNEIDQEYQLSKKSDQIKKKTQPLKRPHNQSSGSHRGGQQGQNKRGKFSNSNQNQSRQGYSGNNHNNRPSLRFDTSRGRGRG